MSRIPSDFPVERLAANMRERLRELEPELRKTVRIWTPAKIRKVFKGRRYPVELERQGRYSAGIVRQL